VFDWHGTEASTPLVTADNTMTMLPVLPMVRRDSMSSVTSQNKQTFHRIIGSFRTVVGSNRDNTAAETLPSE